jgi:sigma-B regulation protein RsbU (phosphoserine phosphatase)
MGSNDWTGLKAGMKTMDRILSADNIPIQSGSDLMLMAEKKPVGSPIRYTVEAGNQRRTITVSTIKFRLRDFFIVFLVPFVGGLAILVLGFIAYTLKPNVSTSWVFFFVCLSLTNYMVTGVEMQSTFRFIHLNYISTPLMPATLFHLGLIFPDRKKIIKRFPILEYLIYAPTFLLILGYQIYLFNFSDAATKAWVTDIGTINTVNRLFSFACVIVLIAVLIHSSYKAATNVSKQRARMILFGVTMAFLPSAIVTTAVFVLKANFPLNFLVFFVIFFPASIAYSIVRHNLFDADAIIKRTVGYVFVTGIVIGAYLLVSVVLNVYMGQYQLAQSRAFPILFSLGFILVFNPLRDRIQVLVDRLFFRKEYDYGAIVEKVGGAMTSLLELPQILKRLTQTFMEEMFINTSSVMLLNPAHSAYQVALADGERQQDIESMEFKHNDTLMQIVEKEKKELTKYDMIEDPKYKEVSEVCAASFEALHASLMVPLVYQDQVIGLLSLGEKKSGKPYNREDIDLLRTIAHQGAVAIENAMMIEEVIEKERMEEELNIAKDLQVSMLPTSAPEVKGFEISAYSISAREVGGDFYDFIDMGEDRVGLVVGDVTGKSVSGALVMSASRSIFRMLSEEKMTVDEIMIRANRRTKKDIKSGMFVALLYAVLNARDKTLSLCSAGQTQPIYLSSKTGETKLVQTEGDTFPLGILEDAEYQETRLQLSPGDKVVFYTDGIVEAMNEQEEMFGFDRLQEVVRGARELSAETLLKEILDNISHFTGEAAQHDDLTAIVVSVTE